MNKLGVKCPLEKRHDGRPRKLTSSERKEKAKARTLKWRAGKDDTVLHNKGDTVLHNKDDAVWHNSDTVRHNSDADMNNSQTVKRRGKKRKR